MRRREYKTEDGRKDGRRGVGEAASGWSKLQRGIRSKGPEVNNVTPHLLHRQDVNHTCALIAAASAYFSPHF